MGRTPKMKVKDERGIQPDTRDIELVINDGGLKVNKGGYQLMHLFYHMHEGWVLDYHTEVGKDERIVFGKDPDIRIPTFADD